MVAPLAPEGGLQPPADQPVAQAVAAMAQQVGAPPQLAPSVIKEAAARHNPAFSNFRERHIHPPSPDLDLPAHDAWAIHILVPHNTAPKTGDATARVTKQLPNTALLYDILTPNVIVTHNTGRDHYYLHATHERSSITMYTFTTYPDPQLPRHHLRPAWKHQLQVAKMALEDTLWIQSGESRTARLADLRTIIPRHIQRAVGPFTVYAVPHPITAQCTHCNPRCMQPCAGAPQQPLTTPTYRGGIYLGTIPGNPHPYLLPAGDCHHAIPLHLAKHLAVGQSPFRKRPPPHPI